MQEELAAPGGAPAAEHLCRCASLLQALLRRQARHFQFDSFPLPTPHQGALCVYTLHQEEGDGLSIRVNAIQGGMNSVVHNHGTWAIIIGIQGQELNRLYRRAANRHASPSESESAEPLQAQGSVADTFTLVGERAVGPGQALIIEEDDFHSIHTRPNEPALQLHVYGRNPDVISDRQVLDPATGRLAGLG